MGGALADGLWVGTADGRVWRLAGLADLGCRLWVTKLTHKPRRRRVAYELLFRYTPTFAGQAVKRQSARR